MVNHRRKNRLFHRLMPNDNDVENVEYYADIVFTNEMLGLIEESNHTIERIRLATHLFLYLADQPGIMQRYTDFCQTTKEKAQECIDDAEIFKARAASGQEGGEFDRDLFDAAESLQQSAKMLQDRIASF